MGDIVSDKDKFKRGWSGGLPETRCGSGSMLKNTVAQREWIPQMVEKYKIRKVADIGAGDLNWIKSMQWDVDYTAYDLVPRADGVKKFDLLKKAPPKVDMLMVLWVLNHLPYRQCKRALTNIIESGSRYLMMTDRPIWRDEQPPEIQMPYIERLVLNEKEDSILLIDLHDLQTLDSPQDDSEDEEDAEDDQA